MPCLHGLVGAGILAPAAFAAGVLLAAPHYPGYGHRRHFLGELGTAASPGAVYYNGGLVVAGLLWLAFAAGVWTVLGTPLITLGLELFGLCAVAMGLFPREGGCCEGGAACGGQLHRGCRSVGLAVGAIAGAALGWRFCGGGPAVLPLCALGLAGAGLGLQVILTGMGRTGRANLVERAQVAAVFGAVALDAVWLLQR